MSYPKWLYHAEEGSCLVRTPEQHEAMGDGWCESPALISPPAPKEPEPIRVEIINPRKSRARKEPKA